MTPTVFLFPGSMDQLEPTGVPIMGTMPRCGILNPLRREELIVAGEGPEKGTQFADDLIKQVGALTVPFRAVKRIKDTWLQDCGRRCRRRTKGQKILGYGTNYCFQGLAGTGESWLRSRVRH